MDKADLIKLINHYKSDTESVYHTWFIGSSERMKAFRAIRRGVIDTVESIKTGKFGTDFKGSTLEVVLNAITEQKQVFKGAAHPFFWKPKLRIPDIYENEINKQHFGAFLEACLVATRDTSSGRNKSPFRIQHQRFGPSSSKYHLFSPSNHYPTF